MFNAGVSFPVRSPVVRVALHNVVCVIILFRFRRGRAHDPAALVVLYECVIFADRHPAKLQFVLYLNHVWVKFCPGGSTNYNVISVDSCVSWYYYNLRGINSY